MEPLTWKLPAAFSRFTDLLGLCFPLYFFLSLEPLVELVLFSWYVIFENNLGSERSLLSSHIYLASGSLSDQLTLISECKYNTKGKVSVHRQSE